MSEQAAEHDVQEEVTVQPCVTCRHHRLRPRPNLFGERQLQHPGVLKAQTEWNQHEQQQAQAEMQRFTARQPFGYEPLHYAWCSFWTRDGDVARATAGDTHVRDELIAARQVAVNPVTGALSPLYVLCAWMNPEGRCDQHEPAPR